MRASRQLIRQAAGRQAGRQAGRRVRGHSSREEIERRGEDESEPYLFGQSRAEQSRAEQSRAEQSR